jgi:GTP cyclohydrolase I
MIPTVNQILEIIDADIAPKNLTEPWDNSGLCIGNPDWPVKKILVALDPCLSVMAAAKDRQADMVLTHHPLFITPEKTIDFRWIPGSIIAMAARENIAVACAHTNLDKARDGLNDLFADHMEISATRPLVPDPPDGEPPVAMTGIGRIGTLPCAVPLARLVPRIKARLGISQVRMVGHPDLMICQVAVCTGSGGSLIPAFLTSGADLYITGDIKYHEARTIESHDRALIDVGHFASEIMAVDLLLSRLNQAVSRAGYDLEINAYTQETDPFTFV